VGLAQGNIQQDKKWDPAFQEETMSRYHDLTVEAAHDHPALVVWPETATPFFFQEPGIRRDEVMTLARDTGVPIVFGSPAYRQLPSGELQELNRVYLVNPSGREQGTYDKMQLVPFGEYVPFSGVLFFVSQVVTAVGRMGAGLVPTVFQIPEGRFGALICYEGIFPSLTRLFVVGGADFLVNVTNDAWYGTTSAPYQHLAQAVFRTVENRVPMVRAANTGISAIVDADGRIRWQGPLFETLWHTEEIQWPGVRTFYTRYGDVFVWLCLAVTLGSVAIGMLRPRR
jgi:apolipoprotein N-acyltransferase